MKAGFSDGESVGKNRAVFPGSLAGDDCCPLPGPARVICLLFADDLSVVAVSIPSLIRKTGRLSLLTGERESTLEQGLAFRPSSLVGSCPSSPHFTKRGIISFDFVG